MIADLIIFGGIIFWVLFAVLSILIIWSLEKEDLGWAVGATIVFLGLFLVLGNGLEVVQNIWYNPLLFLWYGLGYIGIGVVWGLIKWYFYSLDALEIYKKIKYEFCQKNNLMADKPIPEEFKKKWMDFLKNYHIHANKASDMMPKAYEHKSLIVSWMMYWPFSMFWSIIHDMVVRVFDTIQIWIRGIMDAIAKFVWRKVGDDF